MGDVEALYKRHEDLERNLQAQEEKLKGLDDLANKLIAEGHPDKDQWVIAHNCIDTKFSLLNSLLKVSLLIIVLD